MKVLVLTTSYPRGPDDMAGRFVADAVEAVRSRGVEIDVVCPADFNHFGIAYGHGITGNLRAQPWRAAALPLFLWNFRRAARRDCDLVHAHWLGAGMVAATLGRPFVVQLWGTDVELARRLRLAGPVLRRARLVIAASAYLAGQARALGARKVVVVPSAVDLPESVAEPEQPPHVLFVGRLSPEKGIREFLAATEGLPRVIVGAGPVDVPEGVGQVPPARLGAFLERAAIVVCPSRREGYGMVAREAMAWGRPVVASAVGGLADAVEDEVTGLLVPAGDVGALRAAIVRLLRDEALRKRLGNAARQRARAEYSSESAAARLLAAYSEAMRS